ncbi:DUF934 domain-containing protein [Paucibacter sp. KCTC 42545]|uniref:DUF934 domain-containing protein n=1 Tax=Paucibacter sp. KCTC 42545 TaxID=1768242 RepID=UPI000733A59D|nr:DUF934 domain-containing protein [Paucibacter sp. KCTC 42545]ALT79874.1 hypothetical protein AT984_13710 [Paucibacter sp. KCTC 42545]
MKFIDSHHPEWHRVVGEDGPKPDPDPAPNLLLTLEQWHAVRDHWPAGLPTGIELSNDFDVETLAADLPRLSLIVLNFPKWVDGRAYSQAHLLRARYRFAGELRAAGEVLVDMLPLLARTGFTAVQLRAGESVEAAQRALDFFPAHYQGDVDVTQPVFARKVVA